MKNRLCGRRPSAPLRLSLDLAGGQCAGDAMTIDPEHAACESSTLYSSDSNHLRRFPIAPTVPSAVFCPRAPWQKGTSLFEVSTPLMKPQPKKCTRGTHAAAADYFLSLFSPYT
jgi:hypothetical protein